MTEVEICEGGHRTWLRDQLACLWGAPSPVYKGVEEGAGRPPMARPKGGILLLLRVGLPLGRATERVGPPLLPSFI